MVSLLGGEALVEARRFYALAGVSAKISVERTSPTVYQGVKASGKCGFVYSSKTLDEKIATTFGGGEYELRAQYGRGHVVCIMEFPGAPNLDTSSRRDARGAGRRGAPEDGIIRRLGERQLDRALDKLNEMEEGGGGNEGGKGGANIVEQLLPLLQGFLSQMQGKPAVQPYMPAIAELTEKLVKWFGQNAPEDWAGRKIYKSLEKKPEIKTLLATLSPMTAVGWIGQQIQTHGVNLTPQERASFEQWVLAVFVEVQKRVRFGPAPGDAEAEQRPQEGAS
jgi:hypothetical protein